MPLNELVAKKGWFDMPINTITKVAKSQGLAYTAGTTEFEQLFEVTQSCFAEGSVSDDAVLDMLKHRMVALQPDEGALDILMACDDCQEVFDKQDEQEVVSARLSCTHKKTCFREFAKEYVRKRQDVAAASAPAAAAGGKVKKVHLKPATPKRPTLPMSGRITHKDGKKLMPPNSSLWCSRNPGAWNCKVHPLRHSISRSWRRYGEEQALFLVVQEAWKMHCLLSGLPADQCPMDNVYSEISAAGAAEPAAASSSSSSSAAAT